MFKNNTSLQKKIDILQGQHFYSNVVLYFSSDCYFADNTTREISATYKLIIFPNDVNGESELNH